MRRSYNGGKLRSSCGQVDSEKLYCPVVRSVAEALFEETYTLQQFKNETRPVVVRYPYKAGHSSLRLTTNWAFRWSFMRQINEESCVLKSTNAQKSNRSVKKWHSNKSFPRQEDVVSAISDQCGAEYFALNQQIRHRAVRGPQHVTKTKKTPPWDTCNSEASVRTSDV